MNILVIGKGGREHALVQALKNSSNKIYVFPGRSGFCAEYLVDKKLLKTPSELTPFMKEKRIKLVVIGPEKELTEGWADYFRDEGFLVFGPSLKASQLEGSKIFAKEFMEKSNIPTSRYAVVESVEQVLEGSTLFSPPYVLKADGLAGGKGVFICPDQQTLKKNAEKLFDQKIFGKQKALLEEFQRGEEFSIFILTNGEKYQALPLSKDYKKLLNGGEGPNTGGMGAYAPLSLDSSLMKEIHEKILGPTVCQIKKQKLFYRGVLYVGIIVTKEGPKVLEYNVRFGDPECQTLLPLIDGDLSFIMSEVAQGNLSDFKIKKLFSCCVVLAEKNYPHDVKKGEIIQNASDKDILLKTDSSAYFLHAGVNKVKNKWVIDGGRSLNAIGLGASKKEAREKAYSLIQKLENPDLFFFRTDISG